MAVGFRTGLVERLGISLAERIVVGGYPSAVARRREAGRREWYRDYVDTQIQRDVRDLSRIRSFDSMPRLLTAIASQTARLINVAELASPFEVSRATINEYVTLLEHVFLIDRLPIWHASEAKRIIKRPKLHIGDTGVAAALLDIDAHSLLDDRAMLGNLLETFVYQELRRQASWRGDLVRFTHFRDRDDFEVDIVLEQARRVAGVEVKEAATVSDADLRGLRKLRQMAGRRFAAGVVLYDGSAAIRFGDGLFAVPIRRLWEAT